MDHDRSLGGLAVEQVALNLLAAYHEGGKLLHKVAVLAACALDIVLV